MDGKPGERDGARPRPVAEVGQGSREPRSQSEEDSGAPERFGVLELRRLKKDDGRSLISYSRVEREP